MRDPSKRCFPLAVRLAPRLNHDHRDDGLTAVLDTVGQLLHQHSDTLVCDRVLTLEADALGDIFDRQQDLLYTAVRPIDCARVEHHHAPPD